MRPNMTRVVTMVLFMPVILMAGGTIPAVAQGTPAGPASQPATASVAQAPARGWARYRSVPPRTSQPAAKTGQTASRTKTGQPRSGWTGYAPAAAWSGYRAATTSRLAAAPAQPVNNMDRSRVSGPSPYYGNQPRSYHEYGSGRRISLAKPWLPGSP